MKDIDEIVKWTENINGGKTYLKDFAQPQNWGLYRNYYRGEFQHGTAGKREYSVAIIFAILRTMIPRIYFTNPKVVVTNEVPGYYLQSKIVQKIDNKMIRRTKLKRILMGENSTCVISLHRKIGVYTGIIIVENFNLVLQVKGNIQ